MMRSTVLTKILFVTFLWCVYASGLAVANENPVVVMVEIDTIGMDEGKIQNEIAEPVEMLLASLDDVFTVSSQYLMNKAVINVRFSNTSLDPDDLATRVRTTISSYMDKLPNKIESISISFVESSEPIKSENEQATELTTATKPNIEENAESVSAAQKNNRNQPMPEAEVDSESNAENNALSLKNEEEMTEKPGVIRSVEKRSMAGRYLGSIESSNEFLPIITTLVPVGKNTDGVASGKYFMSERDALISGELSGCYNNTGNVLTCQWRDQYGIGGVDLIFTPDYASFNGRWSINGKEGAYKWSGFKVKEN